MSRRAARPTVVYRASRSCAMRSRRERCTGYSTLLSLGLSGVQAPNDGRRSSESGHAARTEAAAARQRSLRGTQKENLRESGAEAAQGKERRQNERAGYQDDRQRRPTRNKRANVSGHGYIVYEGDTGPDIGVFLEILEQVGRLGGWRNTELVCIARCKMVGVAHDFARWDDDVAAAATFSEFKYLALKRFDTEPLIFKIEKFLNARKRADEEVRSFARRLRILGTAILASSDSQDPVKASLRREILAEELLSQFLLGPRDPVRRFVLSRDPKTFDEAIAIAAKEEQNEKVSRSHSLPVRYVEEDTDVHEMHSRLDRFGKLVESLAVRNKVKQDWQEFPKQLPYPGGCSNCSSRIHKDKEMVTKFESGILHETPSHDDDAQRSIAIVNIREETSSAKTSRGSPCGDVVNVISVIEEDVPPLSECVFGGNAGTLVPLGETNAVDVEVASADTDGLAAVSTSKVPRDDEALPVGVADIKLDENGFSEDAVVGVLVDTAVDRTLERVSEIEECLDRNGVVFVGPKGNCSTLDIHRTKPGHAQRWSYKIASHMPHSATELSRWKFGPSNEDPGLGVGEEVCIQVDTERSEIC
ncbi:hypothetical protein HPB51_021913 [Rhipicephalus microplus]|uniref:Retrotransposon gag domain-containing protein n=1 Tax=Rhipicephalus microplus TaxID=6941 RepID=A0A9J6E4P8_RHIMP|nr:hypothetical protein HPB51_021913 [Rhipicephalus microplus]